MSSSTSDTEKLCADLLRIAGVFGDGNPGYVATLQKAAYRIRADALTIDHMKFLARTTTPAG